MSEIVEIHGLNREWEEYIERYIEEVGMDMIVYIREEYIEEVREIFNNKIGGPPRRDKKNKIYERQEIIGGLLDKKRRRYKELTEGEIEYYVDKNFRTKEYIKGIDREFRIIRDGVFKKIKGSKEEGGINNYVYNMIEIIGLSIFSIR